MSLLFGLFVFFACVLRCLCGVLRKAHQAHVRLAEFADTDQQGDEDRSCHAEFVHRAHVSCGRFSCWQQGDGFAKPNFPEERALCGLHSRQDARAQKFRQLSQNLNTSCELALHWMLSRNAGHDYIIVPVTSSGDKRTCRTLESVLIQRSAPVELSVRFETGRHQTRNSCQFGSASGIHDPWHTAGASFAQTLVRPQSTGFL